MKRSANIYFGNDLRAITRPLGLSISKGLCKSPPTSAQAAQAMFRPLAFEWKQKSDLQVAQNESLTSWNNNLKKMQPVN